MGPSGPIFFCNKIGAIAFCFATAPFLSVEFDLDKFSYLVFRQYVGAFTDNRAVNTYLLNSGSIRGLLINNCQRLAVEFEAYRSLALAIEL